MTKSFFLFPFLVLYTLFCPLVSYGQVEPEHNIHAEQQVEEAPSHETYWEDFQTDAWHGEHAVNEPDNFQAKFLNMLFILALLIGFMVLASMMLKRMMRARVTQINQTSLIKVLETRHLSPKSTLYLVEIEGDMLLIAESPTAVNHLASFPAAKD